VISVDAEQESPVLAFVRELVARSPFARQMDLRVEALDRDRAELVMPFAESIVTVGEVVHGGAISTLIDVAATAASWSGADPEDSTRGSTVGLTVEFIRAARGQPLRAAARVLRRGRSLCFCEVEVTDWDDALVAKGLVTYKLG
jgi:uncharacterized protein (TIGR00369 family)